MMILLLKDEGMPNLGIYLYATAPLPFGATLY